uniref:CCHC-type domain-containing protein n=1 Tax=Nothobranchius furzeri TaxID=105023 RepID=A0A8C6LIC1_NOTFU
PPAGSCCWGGRSNRHKFNRQGGDRNSSQRQWASPGRLKPSSCWTCGSQDHISYDCPCWICGSRGHISCDCPCWICGSRGHISCDCPSKPGGPDNRQPNRGPNNGSGFQIQRNRPSRENPFC